MSFPEALAFTLSVEGGWYDGSGSHDPNPTMKGVTQKTYDGFRQRKNLPLRSVKEIEQWELESIYRSYWEAVDGDSLPPKTGAAVFDMAVNAGPLASLKVLQRALGVVADGIVGPQTRQALTAVEDSLLAHKVNVERLKFYVKITRSNPKLRPALLSWVSRVTGFADRFLSS